MKVLHTSDWHLGQVFFNYDRCEEQRDMLRQIVEIVRTEKPDALLVSGDVFHTGSPSSASVEMYNQSILSMHEACPEMQIVVTAGNHDSAARLVANNALWQHFHVTIIGHVAKNQDQERTPDFAAHVVEVRNKEGKLNGYIAAVPHCYESNFPCDDPSLQRSERATAYFQGLSNYVAERNTENVPVVLMAHLAVSGCDFAGHDLIGGMETREAELFGNGFDYVALGHIHTPQNINDHIRYCGTPIPVNFGEKFQHSVSLVTLEKGRTPEVKTCPIKNLIPLHDFPTQLPDKNAVEMELPEDKRPRSFDAVLEDLRNFSNDVSCYLRVVVKVDDKLSPLANTLIADALKGKKCRFCLIKPFMYQAALSKAEKARTVKLDTDELKSKSPLEIAEMFFAMKGIELSDHKRELIQNAEQLLQ